MWVISDHIKIKIVIMTKPSHFTQLCSITYHPSNKGLLYFTNLKFQLNRSNRILCSNFYTVLFTFAVFRQGRGSCFEIQSQYVTVADLELIMYTRLPWIHLLPSARIKDHITMPGSHAFIIFLFFENLIQFILIIISLVDMFKNLDSWLCNLKSQFSYFQLDRIGISGFYSML